MSRADDGTAHVAICRGQDCRLVIGVGTVGNGLAGSAALVGRFHHPLHGRHCGAHRRPENDPDRLGEVVESWPARPQLLTADILAMIRAAHGVDDRQLNGRTWPAWHRKRFPRYSQKGSLRRNTMPSLSRTAPVVLTP